MSMSRILLRACTISGVGYQLQQVDACLQHVLTCSMQPPADPRICLSTSTRVQFPVGNFLRMCLVGMKRT
ncbi:hypothetical protein EVAR_23771_1 [Eumeta japonica]|uniref:Uncharacterized protein n=1 Tax=Eumeta variegata TaxID=151549 RepID=A0A4C1VGX9_EUMVA|nr:hypothetical protein EVAR_23771_1 [Eumeta japonica]